MDLNNSNKQSFNLKDLLDENEINKYKEIEEQEKNNESNTISEEEQKKIRREEVLKKLKEKKEAFKNKRLGKVGQQKNQINQLMSNPLFSNLNLNNNDEIKKAIELMAGKITNDSKQKKNAKKQIAKLVDKMKDINLK